MVGCQTIIFRRHLQALFGPVSPASEVPPFSDGLGTGLVVFVFLDIGLSLNESHLKKAIQWPKSGQNRIGATGAWTAFSLNDPLDSGKNTLISDAATAYALLGLDKIREKEGENPPPRRPL